MAFSRLNNLRLLPFGSIKMENCQLRGRVGGDGCGRGRAFKPIVSSPTGRHLSNISALGLAADPVSTRFERLSRSTGVAFETETLTTQTSRVH